MAETKRLERKKAELQRKPDRAYEDLLEGTVDESSWRDMNAAWCGEKDQIISRLDRLQTANREFVDEAAQILELAKTAYSQYMRQGTAQKRQLLKKVLSNRTFDGVTLYPTNKNPFNPMAEGVENQK